MRKIEFCLVLLLSLFAYSNSKSINWNLDLDLIENEPEIKLESEDEIDSAFDRIKDIVISQSKFLKYLNNSFEELKKSKSQTTSSYIRSHFEIRRY